MPPWTIVKACFRMSLCTELKVAVDGGLWYIIEFLYILDFQSLFLSEKNSLSFQFYQRFISISSVISIK